MHTGKGQPPYEWLSLVLRLRVYGCSRDEFDAMRPVHVMQDLMLLGAEASVRRVKSGGGARRGVVRRGMAALRQMVRRG